MGEIHGPILPELFSESSRRPSYRATKRAQAKEGPSSPEAVSDAIDFLIESIVVRPASGRPVLLSFGVLRDPSGGISGIQQRHPNSTIYATA
jgi:hypothetical protein